jgi:hypothetical protein
MRPYRCLTVAIIGALMVALYAVSAGAFIHDIAVVPAHPTSQDSLHITVSGELIGCFHMESYTCEAPPTSKSGCQGASGFADAFDRNINLYAVDDYQEGDMRPVEGPPYSETCHYGPLPVGFHAIVVTEHHDSAWFPDSDCLIRFFMVSPPTPIGPMTWGRVKSLYR